MCDSNSSIQTKLIYFIPDGGVLSWFRAKLPAPSFMEIRARAGKLFHAIQNRIEPRDVNLPKKNTFYTFPCTAEKNLFKHLELYKID